MSNKNLNKLNIIEDSLCYICKTNKTEQQCIQCQNNMCQNISCKDYNTNNLCYLCFQKNNKLEEERLISIGALTKCENCGNVWDGNAQCHCWFDSYWSDTYTDSEEEMEINKINDNNELEGIHIIPDYDNIEPLQKKRRKRKRY